MAKFLNTSAVTYHLEELIKQSHERLILISPYLKFNDRMRELLEDRDRLKIDIRIVYGKSELQPDETNWLKGLDFVRTSFCKNLHAKCYINESRAIITSMNLYEFSQVNNNEMGVLIERDNDPVLYQETYQEVQRLIRISDEIKVTVEKVARDTPPPVEAGKAAAPDKAKSSAAKVAEEPVNAPSSGKKLSATQLAKKKGVKVADINAEFIAKGWLVAEGDKLKLTPEGIKAGGEVKRGQYGEYVAWPEEV